jgi:hypothetical protein
MPGSTKSFNPNRIKNKKTTKEKPQDQACAVQKEPPVSLQTASGIALKSL